MKLAKIKELLWGLLALAIIAGVASVVLVRQQPEPIKIGVILPLTGPFPEGAQKTYNGIELAVEEVNAQGGINGRPLEIVLEDGAFDTDSEVQAFTSIEESARPLFYVGEVHTISGAISDKLQAAEVVFLQIVLADAFNSEEWIFEFGLDVKGQTEPIVSLLETFDVEKLGMLYLKPLLNESEKRQYETAFETQGKTMLFSSFEFGQTDYTDEINQLSGTGAIYYFGPNRSVSSVVEQARALGYTGPILTVPPYLQAVPFESPPGEAVYLGAPAIYKPNFVFAREVAERYRARYAEPFNINAGFGYGAIHLMSDLLEGEELTRSNVKSVLDQGFSYGGVFGNAELLAGSHDISFPLFPARILDGKLEYLQ